MAMGRVRPGAYAIVLVTCGTRREADRIAKAVVGARLAACVNVLEAPARSVYRWHKKVEQAREFLLLIKTTKKRLKELEAEVRRRHSYKVPEFIAIPLVGGSEPYLAWVAESCA